MDDRYTQKAPPAPVHTEHQLMSHDRNAARQLLPQNLALHQLFEAQVQRTPDAIALLTEQQQLSYAELNRRANQLAHYLQHLGVGPEVLVGLCLPRCAELVIALLAILKAGGAYVPLDPRYPLQRLSFMLADAHTSLVLTQQSWLEQQGQLDVTTLCLENLPALLSQQSIENPPGWLQPENLATATSGLAYVIYTSGSTGRPKGVAITHRSAVALLAWAHSVFAPELLSGMLASTSISFDLSIFELLLPLSSGGRVLLVEDLLHLADWPAAQAVTLLNTVPSVLQAFLAAAPLPTALHTVTLAGEPLPADLVRRLYAQPGVQQVYNLYGPSEDTTYSTWSLLSPQIAEPVPIGWPIANSQAYVLDAAGQPVPIGMVGELYLGGTGLARGYLRQPDFTADRFLPDPFSSQPGQRLYRTGDLVRYLPDGALAFIGRRDGQIKLRGYRIELGEIEAVLREHPGVREAVVLLREVAPRDKRLLAYLVPQAKSLLEDEVRTYLGRRLPYYMLPSALILLEHFPLSPNGKMDRDALPLPAALPAQEQIGYVAPRTPLEEVLADIWAEVLGQQVGVDDNFFALGGHSLLATQVIARVRNILKVELPLYYLFEAPSVAELSRIITRENQRPQNHSFSSRTPVPADAPAPLTFPQERIWFLQQLNPDSIAYHFQATLSLSGPFSVKALAQSLNEIIQRHEIMRTTFPALHGQPVQLVHQPYPVNLPVIALQALLEGERVTAMQQLINNEFRKSFNLSQLPLVRWLLVRLDEQEHVLVHVEHHLLHDGWSFNVFLRELFSLYQAFNAGRPSPLAELPIQFSDFARWQRQWIQGEVAATQLAYWKEKLTGSSPVLPLPTSRPRPAVQSFRGATPRVEIPIELCEALRQVSRQQGVTLFMTMLAAFLALLYRYSGQDDFCVGTGIANRRWHETETLIGMIINTLVLRTKLSGTLTFREFLRQVRQVTLEAYAHQDVPFDKVVEAIQPGRNLGQNPLFQVMFAFHDSPLPDLKLPGVSIHLLEALSNGSAKFDLNVIVIPRAEQRIGSRAGEDVHGITMLWEYSTDLFDEVIIRRMIGHYQRLLEGIVADPEQRLVDLPLLSEAERRLLLHDWNTTAQPFPQDLGVHQLVEAQVLRTPDAIALVWEDEQLTYHELNRRANQLAHRLLRLGVGVEKLVGVCLPRRPELVIALLAILKAGGAYLPLDPAYPSERLAYMLHDSQACLLLTWGQEGERLGEVPVRQLWLEHLELDGESEVDPAVGLLAGQLATATAGLAYVIYTSGSTGQPKGTQITHSSLVNLLFWHQQAFELSPKDRATHLAGLSFDAATWELWPYLLSGACICLLDEQTRLAPILLQHWLRSHAITISFVPTPLAEQMLTLDWSQPPPLRTLLVGGDQLHPVHSLPLPFALVNNYGPTENTVVATSGLVTAEQSAQLPSIGRPIANSEVYVLDTQGQPVPIGVIGELYLGGAGVARGYLNQPELTAERFVPHTFSSLPGARLYRTGDLARYQPDGKLAFVGRQDSQVKLRGYRIELGEIEVMLRQHPQVREAVALVREDLPGDKRLVGYVVPGERVPTTGELRAYLAGKLPDYMIPSALILLGSLPLSPNGKVDRGELPAPDQLSLERQVGYVAPRTPLEEVLAGIWAEVLGLEQVGVEDNFFALGGHSLLSTQIVARVYELLQMDLPLRSFFEQPTVAEQAAMALQNEGERRRIERTAQLLTRLALLSENEVQTILEGKAKLDESN